jgi:hypothetical protein
MIDLQNCFMVKLPLFSKYEFLLVRILQDNLYQKDFYYSKSIFFHDHFLLPHAIGVSANSNEESMTQSEKPLFYIR